MKYIMLSWSLAGIPYLDGNGRFVCDTNIDVDIEGTKHPNPIHTGNTVDLTGLTIDETITEKIREKCQKWVDDKYNS